MNPIDDAQMPLCFVFILVNQKGAKGAISFYLQTKYNLGQEAAERPAPSRGGYVEYWSSRQGEALKNISKEPSEKAIKFLKSKSWLRNPFQGPGSTEPHLAIGRAGKEIATSSSFNSAIASGGSKFSSMVTQQAPANSALMKSSLDTQLLLPTFSFSPSPGHSRNPKFHVDLFGETFIGSNATGNFYETWKKSMVERGSHAKQFLRAIWPEAPDHWHKLIDLDPKVDPKQVTSYLQDRMNPNTGRIEQKITGDLLDKNLDFISRQDAKSMLDQLNLRWLIQSKDGQNLFSKTPDKSILTFITSTDMPNKLPKTLIPGIIRRFL